MPALIWSGLRQSLVRGEADHQPGRYRSRRETADRHTHPGAQSRRCSIALMVRQGFATQDGQERSW